MEMINKMKLKFFIGLFVRIILLIAFIDFVVYTYKVTELMILITKLIVAFGLTIIIIIIIMKKITKGENNGKISFNWIWDRYVIKKQS